MLSPVEITFFIHSRHIIQFGKRFTLDTIITNLVLWCDISNDKLKWLGIGYSTYLGQVQAVVQEFDKLIPVTASVEKQQKQRQKMFLVL